MGNGIAHVVALAGYNVILNDMERERFDAAMETIEKNLRRQVSRDLIEREAAEKTLGRITFG
ncbi:MAG: 3-hydroxybutyryl-CoA dehydrogenase, partial [Deltaproteobacteria bacterium]|nr:3-hydroxybutyryl-CoA dehydrogenase [Deltaproteobacteria bacterium]